MSSRKMINVRGNGSLISEYPDSCLFTCKPACSLHGVCGISSSLCLVIACLHATCSPPRSSFNLTAFQFQWNCTNAKIMCVFSQIQCRVNLRTPKTGTPVPMCEYGHRGAHIHENTRTPVARIVHYSCWLAMIKVTSVTT